jgi:hypothetical protein
MAGKTAEMAMRPLQDVFMLERETELNMGTLKNIMATGHSESFANCLCPVWRGIVRKHKTSPEMQPPPPDRCD